MSKGATRAPAAGLGAQIRAVLGGARDTFDDLPEPSNDERADLEGITRLAIAVLRDPQAAQATRRRALTLGTDSQDLLHALHEHRRAHRDAMLSEVQQGLRGLRHISSSAELLDRVCTQAVRSCALERIMLSRVDGDVWRPWMLDFSDDREVERQMIEAMRGSPIALDDSPIERTILAARRPAIVGNVRPDHSYAPILGISRSTSYVVVPVAPAGRVVGLLHGDHGPDGPRVDLVDRDVLWTFAEGFGRIYERTELHERLRAQRERVQDAFEVVEATIAAVDATEIELGERVIDGQATGDEPWTTTTQENRAVDDLLTDREREVLALMVRGQNNATIAERLVIREGTVKSHVKHILRKLGAVNRTEAISRYMAS